MKKIISMIVTAAMCAASAVPALAADKITAEEVKAYIWSSGIENYPELLEINVESHILEENNILEERRLTDIIDIKKSYRSYGYCKNEDGIYTIDKGTEDMDFKCIDENGNLAEVEYSKSYYDGRTEREALFYSDHCEYGRPDGTIGEISLAEAEGMIEYGLNYSWIADRINAADIGKVSRVAKVGGCVFVKTETGEYAIPLNSTEPDIHAQYLGREEKNYTQGEIIPFNDYINIWFEREKNIIDDGRTAWEIMGTSKKSDPIIGDAVRDTDTLAQYAEIKSSFSDVNDELEMYVNALAAMNIITGYDDGTFRPEASVTRAEAAAMLARMLGYSEEYDGRFSDVDGDAWYAGEVAALADKGIINGTTANTFSPDAEISYLDMLKILVYTLGYGEYTNMYGGYPDGIIPTAVNAGLTERLSSFDTAAGVTRGDMAILLSTALDCHLFTSNTSGGISAYERDITLIDYINGGKLNGVLNAE